MPSTGQKILYLYSQVLHVGTPHARQAFQMLDLLRQAGFEVDILTLAGGDPWPKGLAGKVYSTARIPFARTLPAYGRGPRRWWATMVLTLAAIRLCLHRRYRVIHCADRAIRVGAILAWLFGGKFIFEWRTASGHDLIAWLQKRSRRFIRSVGLVLSDVPYPFARLRETPLCGRIATIPMLPAPFITRLPPPPVRLKGKEQPFLLVALSQARHFQDLAPLCEALPELLAYPNIRVLLVGGNAHGAERLRHQLTLHLPEAAAKIEVRPQLSGGADFLNCIAAADLVFFPLVNGALPPAALLDVMAAQRAILAVRCPAYETLLTTKNAALVPANPRVITSSILRHIVAPLLCADHAIAAADTIEQDCSATATAAALRSCYRFALSGGRS